MAIIKRNQVKKKEHEVAVTESDFLAKAEDYQVDIDPDLKELSLDELAVRYEEIDRQSHILKGKILLEAKTRFDSDKEFGQWVASQTLCLGSTQKTRNRLMHLAKFFDSDNRDMDGISITTAYEISSPANKKIAEKIYEEAHEKNLSVEEVKTLILDNSEKQDDTKAKKEDRPESDLCVEEELAIKIVDKILKGETPGFKHDVLQRALKYLDNQK
jgi:hypothetical protein